MALRPFHLGAAALRIAAVTSLARTLHGRAQIIFFSVYPRGEYGDTL